MFLHTFLSVCFLRVAAIQTKKLMGKAARKRKDDHESTHDDETKENDIVKPNESDLAGPSIKRKYLIQPLSSQCNFNAPTVDNYGYFQSQESCYGLRKRQSTEERQLPDENDSSSPRQRARSEKHQQFLKTDQSTSYNCQGGDFTSVKISPSANTLDGIVQTPFRERSSRIHTRRNRVNDENDFAHNNHEDILSAHFHQSNIPFTNWEKYQGNQCTSMSLTAVIYHHRHPIHLWTRDDLDAIILEGDEVHAALLEFVGRSKDATPRVALSDIPRCMSLATSGNEFLQIDRSAESIGILGQIEDDKERGFVTMQTCLNEYLQMPGDNCIVTIGEETMAIMMDMNHCVRYFDSHCRNTDIKSNGQRLGAAILQRFADIDEFVTFITNLKCPGTQFEVIKLIITNLAE